MHKLVCMLCITLALHSCNLRPTEPEKKVFKEQRAPLMVEESAQETFWHQAQKIAAEKGQYYYRIRKENPQLASYQCEQKVDILVKQKLRQLSVLAVKKEHPLANLQEAQWQQEINKHVEDFMHSNEYQCAGCCCIIQ